MNILSMMGFYSSTITKSIIIHVCMIEGLIIVLKSLAKMMFVVLHSKVN